MSDLHPELLEIDGRQSGEVYYQIVVHIGSYSLALIARGPEDVRALPIPNHLAGDALAHPEAYLGAEDTIHAFE